MSVAWLDGRGAVIETDSDGALGLVHVDWLGAVTLIPLAPGDAPTIGLFPLDYGGVVVTAAADGNLLFHEFDPEVDRTSDSQFPPPAPQLEPLAVWWGTEDEGAILVAAYRQPDGTVGIHSMEWETYTFEPEAQLYVHADRLDDVRVAAREEATVVVGPVGPDPAHLPIRDSVWEISTTPDLDSDGQWLPRTWTTVSLGREPDAFTDIDGWDGDVILAGRLDNRPLVWVVDVGLVDLPEIELASNGAVLVADPFWLGDEPAIGLEEVDGPMLLMPRNGGWETIEMPDGRLNDVAAIPYTGLSSQADGSPGPEDGRLLAIVDGVVWLRTYGA